jgi:L-idonate 5-dehydrogenase
MRAVVIHAAKDLRIEPVAVGEPGPGEVRIRLERGGICGSDLHYYHDGRIGSIVLREPMVLGHEVAGLVEQIGAGVDNVAPGDRVAVSPSRPCRTCRYCQAGKQMHCLDMRFYGSAMRFPHVQGAFQEALVAEQAQCFKVPANLSAGEAAMCEPFAVTLHAVRRAGPLLGKRVLVTGCGPIGVLTILAAHIAGAAEIIATDVTEAPFALARTFGANLTLDVAANPAALAPYTRDKGYFDVLMECSGNERALLGGLDALAPQGIVVQVGLGGHFSLPVNLLVAKEIELRGTFRFHEEFALAAALIGSRRVDVRPLISAVLPVERAVEAFDLASDRNRAMKVQLAFA